MPRVSATSKAREDKSVKNINDLFLHFLKDMYYAEQQTLRTLPQMMAAAQSEALRRAFDARSAATRNHVAQLEKVFEAVGKRPEGATCEALLGMVKETEDLLKETGTTGPVQDAGLIASIQAIQHYAIARYGALLAWANEMGQKQAAATLKQMLDAVKQSDAMLNQLATKGVNQAASGQA
jgi:ferritin-like metal-binding protein YciE